MHGRGSAAVMLLILGTTVLLLAGCTATRLTSVVNPEVGAQGFSRVMVHGNFQDLAYRRAAERTFCAEVEARTTATCIPAETLFFPGEEHSTDEVEATIRGRGIEAVLVIQPTGQGTTSVYLPQSSYTTGSATISGNTVTGSSTTVTYGGYAVKKPWSKYEIYLWSVPDERVTWYATGLTRGNAYVNWEDLVRATARRLVGTLLDDGMLLPARHRRKHDEEGDDAGGENAGGGPLARRPGCPDPFQFGRVSGIESDRGVSLVGSPGVE